MKPGESNETAAAPARPRGSLIVVGSGIEAVGQATLAAQGAIENADEVLYLVADWLTADWITSLNPACESLYPFYAVGRDRSHGHGLMVERILRAVRTGHRVCAVFYGHPGVFASPSHEAIRVARAEGYQAQMLPGVSAEDCLWADLGIDPGTTGCQSYEATDFLVRRRTVETTTPLLLWEVGSVGKLDYQREKHAFDGFQLLAERLTELYGPEHEATLYEAARFGVCDPRIERLPLGKLRDSEPNAACTLFIPGRGSAPLDEQITARLGIKDDRFAAADAMELDTRGPEGSLAGGQDA